MPPVNEIMVRYIENNKKKSMKPTIIKIIIKQKENNRTNNRPNRKPLLSLLNKQY